MDVVVVSRNSLPGFFFVRAARMQIHVIPENDLKPHIKSTDCWCEPDQHFADDDSGKLYPDGNSLVQHHAADGREAAEELMGEGLGDHKMWENYQVE